MSAMSQKSQNKLLTICFLCLAIAFVGSLASSGKNNESDVPKDPGSNSSQSNESDPLGCVEKDKLNPKGLKEAWRHFTADGRYRIARENDFNLPMAAITKRIEDRLKDLRENGPTDAERERLLASGIRAQYLEKTKCPLLGAGDFNRDGNWYDLAVIVVDTQNTSADRFGLVIFNRQKNDDDLCIPIWLYQNRDLSKTVILNVIKDNLMISELRDDGSIIECWVHWDSINKKYSCEE